MVTEAHDPLWWHSAAKAWLDGIANAVFRVQRAEHVKQGRRPNTFRWSPPDWHRQAVSCLNRNDEAGFKAIRLDVSGLDAADAAKDRWS